MSCCSFSVRGVATAGFCLLGSLCSFWAPLLFLAVVVVLDQVVFAGMSTISLLPFLRVVSVGLVVAILRSCVVCTVLVWGQYRLAPHPLVASSGLYETGLLMLLCGQGRGSRERAQVGAP